MIRRIVKPALSILSRSARPLLVNSIRPSYSFVNDIQATSKFRSALQQEVKHEQQNIQNLREFTNYFENQGWKVRYDGIQIELLKKNGLYNLRMLFNARAPMSDYQPQQQGQQNQIQQDQEYSQIAVYLRKDGSQKWLALDFYVYNNSQAEISSAAFITDYEAEKNERKKGKTLDGQYNGPEIQSLDEKLYDSFFGFLETTGINGEILQRASQFSVAYQQQFYLGWLKDLQRIL